MSGHKKISIIGTTVVLLIIITAGALALIHKFTPSEKVMPLTDYYQVETNEVLVVMQDSIYEKKGLIEDKHVYIDYDTVKSAFNKRFYWDNNEEILSYTTPEEVITSTPGQLEYYSNGEEKTSDYPIVIMQKDIVYIAIDFVEKYSDMEFNYFDNPNRVVITYKWGDYLFTNVKKQTQLRYEPSIKGDILAELAVGALLTFVDTSETTGNHFSKVMTVDGVIGYVKNSQVEESQYKTLTSKFVPKEYSHISMEGDVNLVWHQVTNQDANNNLLQLLGVTKGVNVVSPTWFSLADNEGNITSLADKKYVERAHENGIFVWALVDDFNTEVDKSKLLSSTASRSHLIKELMVKTSEYKLDGINIDFEKVPQDAGEHFIQFIRELSVICREEGIVLSIDNYVPASYNSFYDWNEQGVVADYVIVMAYDEHHAGSKESGSVSSIGFVQNAVTEILNYVPKERVIMALPFYTRQWKEETGDGGALGVTSQAYGMQTAQDILKQNGGTPKWDDVTGQYYGEYTLDGALYRIWLEEEESIEKKLKVITEADVAGIAGWKLGLEKAEIWDVITKYVNE
ncbi:MAG: hypothetical protein K0S61_837 [Anaerocolumna sp.]|jgi:spore germination protein YaaH|nr:hypothetical protein [Anaerocolumna sp.]